MSARCFSSPRGRALSAVALSAGLAAAITAPRPAVAARLDPAGWPAAVHAELEAALAELAERPPGDGTRRPFAVFDFDNTLIKNDVGKATLVWMTDHDRVRRPPEGDWSRTSRFLTATAARALATACGDDVAPGEPLPTSTRPACRLEILSVARGRTSGGDEAFAGYDHHRFKPTAAWAASLHAGWTRAESGAFAAAALADGLAAPQGPPSTLGAGPAEIRIDTWLRYYEPMRHLIAALEELGVDVWVLSASPEQVVAVAADALGVPAERVIGVRNRVDEAGRLDYGFQGCGPVGDDDASLITYRAGKRCWMNRVILGVRGDEAIEPRPQAADRPWLAAGDSVTDLDFVSDATRVHLVIDRGEPELLCHARANLDGHWLVAPMFLEPRTAVASAVLPCASSACVDAAGAPGPCRDPRGQVLADQRDAEIAGR